MLEVQSEIFYTLELEWPAFSRRKEARDVLGTMYRKPIRFDFDLR